MSLQSILDFRRAIRNFDPAQPLDDNVVRQCIEMATLAPTSSNMQLWEAVHVTDPAVMAQLAHACLDQKTATTAQQMVVFVARHDLHRKHAKQVLDLTIDNIRQTSPAERQEHRIKLQTTYYTRVMPLFYSRFLGLIGLFRKTLSFFIGLFRPIVWEVSEAEGRITTHKSCALAVQTFMLAMAEAGYDTCPLEGYDSRRIRRILNLPCGAEVNMLITCGKRLPDGVWGNRVRLPFEQMYRKV